MSEQIKKTARRSALGALFVAWWEWKEKQNDSTLTVWDLALLAGLGLGWLLERQSEEKK